MTLNNKYFLILILALHSFISDQLLADQWPQFRGPRMDGVATSEFPSTWDSSKNVRWKIPIEGEGWSCPVIWDDKVFLTTAVRIDKKETISPADRRFSRGGRARTELLNAKYHWEVICLNAKTGEIQWKKTAKTGHPSISRHGSNSYATETPVTDGKHVYAYFGMTGLYCYDMEGSLKWKKDLGSYEMRAGWGTSSSPILFEGKLFLQIDNQEQSFLVALDAKTGDQIWRVKREEPSQYSSPIIWQNSKRNELITGGEISRSYDPENGKMLWELNMEKGRSCATPIAVDDRLYIGTEFRNRGRSDDGGGFLFKVKPGGSGDITLKLEETSSKYIEWKITRCGIQMASPLLCQGHLYFLERRRGLLHCINADSGTVSYRTRIPGSHAFWSSPWSDGKNIYCLDDSGTTHVLSSGPELKIIRKNVIDEQAWSSPGIAGGSLFLRTIDHLYCISNKKN